MHEATPTTALYEPRFPKSWARVPLISLADWVNGLAFRGVQFGQPGLPIIKIAELKEGITPQTRYTSAEYDPAVRVQSGDLLFAWSGQPESSIGAFWWLGPAGWLNQHIFKVRPRADVDRSFLYFLLKYLRQTFVEIARNKQTTGLGHVTRKDLARLVVGIPDAREQRQIAACLAPLDDKIELNRRMAETLEEIARTLFKAWFVDFDPIRHPDRWPPEIRRLFPDDLTDSPIGPVPGGWSVERLGEQVEVVRGLSYTGAGLADDGMPLHNLNSVLEGGGYKYDGIKHYVGDYRERDRVLPGDLIVANTEQGFDYLLIGYPAIVPRAFGDDGLYSQDLFRLRPAEGSNLNSRFLYLLLMTHRLRHEVTSYTNGTTVNHLSIDGLRRPRIAVPPAPVLAALDGVVAPMFDLQEVLVAESRTLAELRDLLLPKLISGEIRVGEAAEA